MPALLPPLLALAIVSADAAAPVGVPFRTDAAPRMDPVFGGVASLRAAIDDFFALHAETEKVRDELSAAVHATLAQLGSVGARAAKRCPSEVQPLYARTADAGRRFLDLGRRLAARFREIERAEQVGETAGLTPDYRMRAKKAGDLYRARLRDYREMRAAVYDQLGAEMRHAGCKTTGSASTPPPGAKKAADPTPADPGNPRDWLLEPGEEVPIGPAGKGTAGRGGEASAAASGGGPGIWIKIDNTRCAQASTLTLDGVAIGEIAGHKNVPVRTRAGPHELCLLPAGDKRPCGAPGTVRRAYLYDGWTLAVRCQK